MIETRTLRVVAAVIEALWERELERGILLIGPAGSGKSAVLRQLEERYRESVLAHRAVAPRPEGSAGGPAPMPPWLRASDVDGKRRILLLDGFDAVPELRECASAWRPGDAIVVATGREQALCYMPNFFFPYRTVGMSSAECRQLMASLDPSPPAESVVEATARVLVGVTQGLPGRILDALGDAQPAGGVTRASGPGCDGAPASSVEPSPADEGKQTVS